MKLPKKLSERLDRIEQRKPVVEESVPPAAQMTAEQRYRQQLEEQEALEVAFERDGGIRQPKNPELTGLEQLDTYEGQQRLIRDIEIQAAREEQERFNRRFYFPVRPDP